MYLTLKIVHISAMAVWFTGLCFLPHLFRARQARPGGSGQWRADRLVNTVYFRVMTPAGVLTVLFGALLLMFAQPAAWLVMKMALVMIAVFVHLYLGVILYGLGQGGDRHGAAFHVIVGWMPLLLVVALAALTAGKPATLGNLPASPASAAGGHSLSVVNNAGSAFVGACRT